MAGLRDIQQYSAYLSLGAEITAGMLVPIAGGYLVDYYWQTEPWGVIVGMIVGFLQVFNTIFKIARRASKKNGGPQKNQSKK